MKVAVVGLGIQGRKRRAIAGSDIVVTVDPIEDADYRSIESVPRERYDAVLVCTPDEPKLEILSYLLSDGKHVLVEKPLLARRPEDLVRIQELATARTSACYTAYNHRFEPHIARLKQVLDDGVIGRVYLVRAFYGNGTARDVRDSAWRDKGEGVLPDLGSHLLDICLFLLGRPTGLFRAWSHNRFENRAFDHFLFGSNGEPVLELEITLLSWRNTFTLDIYGDLGSAHINGLCKWGPSVLTIRKRVLPSGRPEEKVYTIESRDPTWALEYEHFKELCRNCGTNIGNDLWINSVLNGLSEASA
jgi:scyllo-inositol 2-dehydrogenase (NADP+)